MSRRTIIDCDLCKTENVNIVDSIWIEYGSRAGNPEREVYGTQVDICGECAIKLVRHQVGDVNTESDNSRLIDWFSIAFPRSDVYKRLIL
jgi:hypothetical protein